MGRRLVLAVLGLGAAGAVAAPALQRTPESGLGAVADQDPTGPTGLLLNGGGFRYCSVASSVTDAHGNGARRPGGTPWHAHRVGRAPLGTVTACAVGGGPCGRPRAREPATAAG